MNEPKYWMDETSGRLRRAVEAYLKAGPMTDDQISYMRAYLRQWIMSPEWGGDEKLDQLRAGVDGLTSREAIDKWIVDALVIVIDPL